MPSRMTPALLCTALAVTACGTVPAMSSASSSVVPITAADGRNVAACADGNCEVEVTAAEHIKLTGEGDVVLLTVDGIDSHGLSFTATSTSGGTSTGSIQHGCTLTLYQGGDGSSCGGRQNPPAAQTGVLAMQLVQQTGHTAVLRLVAGKPGRPPAWLVPPLPTF